MSRKQDLNKKVLKFCQKFCLEFSYPGEPYDNENGKIIKFKPFSINPEIFK